MERWLAQRLSDRLGVCANVDFPSPGRVAADAVAVASGIAAAGAAGTAAEDDPRRPERMVWPLLDVVDAHLREPWLERLAGHLGNGEDPLRRGRRFSTLRHLADLFSRYALYRPDMVRAWAAG